jgi:hypothetical protein
MARADRRYGTPRPLDDVDIDAVLAHPIWVWVWEAGLEDADGVEDETWQCPVLDTNDVSAAMTEPVITLRVEGSDAIASASFDPREDRLVGISVWHEGAWVDFRDAGLADPIVLVAIPTLRGVAGVRFACDLPGEDRARRLD